MSFVVGCGFVVFLKLMLLCVIDLFVYRDLCDERGPRSTETSWQEEGVFQLQAVDILWSRCRQEDLSGVQRHMLQCTERSDWPSR